MLQTAVFVSCLCNFINWCYFGTKFIPSTTLLGYTWSKCIDLWFLSWLAANSRMKKVAVRLKVSDLRNAMHVMDDGKTKS
jgi:hypothetical protein